MSRERAERGTEIIFGMPVMIAAMMIIRLTHPSPRGSARTVQRSLSTLTPPAPGIPEPRHGTAGLYRRLGPKPSCEPIQCMS